MAENPRLIPMHGQYGNGYVTIGEDYDIESITLRDLFALAFIAGGNETPKSAYYLADMALKERIGLDTECSSKQSD